MTLADPAKAKARAKSLLGPIPSTRRKFEKNSHVFERDPHDWYVEPVAVTSALIRVEVFGGLTWDPCCGGGNIPRAFDAAGLWVIGTDIEDRTDAPWFVGTRDFIGPRLDLRRVPKAANIVMNPPFFRAKGTEAFIRRALRIATTKVAAFMSVGMLSSEDRALSLWAQLPPTRIYILSPRQSCPPGVYIDNGGKPQGGLSDWMWCVWDKTAPTAAAPTLHWLWITEEERS